MASKRAVAALAAASLALSGCAGVPRYLAWLLPHRAPLTVQPVETASAETTVDATGRLYDAAVDAIDARDYARSLDLLQLARERSPDDVRVLNALAVTYDKLGRFDLSARFYAQALEAAPDSPVVMANMAYSQVLQRQFTPAPTQLAEAPPSEPAALQPGAPELASPRPMLTLATPRLVGRPLVVVNAGGDGETVRRRLAVLGWSVTRGLRQVPRVTESRILYPAEHRAVALALANTLPFSTQMAACNDDCRGLSLILGENAQWRG